MESNEQTTTNYRLFLMDDAYKEKSNLKRYVSEAQDFYNGKQYPNENYRNMVRVTMNFCSFSSNLKAAKVVGTQRYITFTADDVSYDCRKLQRFDEYNMKKLDESTEDFQTCLDGFNNGTAVVCYRWDEGDTTYKGIYKGGLALDQIDILRFAVANPHLKGIQNQKWVMYWKDEDVSAVRDMVERDSKKELEEARKAIVPDSYDPKTASDNEDVSHGLVTVYTRYFRIGGEVYFMSSTKTVDLYERPHALNPRLNELADEKARKEMAEGSRIEDYSSMDPQDPSFQVADAQIMDDGEYGREKEKFSLYPFAEFRPYAINNSFYGRSDIKDMIPIQKGVNFALSMTLKCVENNAYNKIFAKEGALEGQTITNEPGQVLTDHSRMTNGWGIKFAESQPMPNGVVDFTERLFQMTRIVYGFNDVMDGSVNNQDLSGYAVQQMIKQANSSIEQQQQLFWKFCKDKAAIRLQFYKFYVDSAKYSYEMPDYEVDREEQARKALQARQSQLQGQNQSLSIGDVDLSTPTRKVQIRDFKGSEIYGTRFDIEIDVMQGLADSKLAESQMWDTLIMNGNIQNLTPEMLELYLEANPTISERTKATLKNVVERQKRSENEQLKGKLQEALQYLQKVTEYAKELEAQNGYKTNYINNLTKEFTEKIGVANKVIGAQNKALAGQTKEQQSIQNSKNASKGDFDPGAGGTMA